jgi:MoxR-like ATPase
MTTNEHQPGRAAADRGASPAESPDWRIYRGTGRPGPPGLNVADLLPPPPPWRTFNGGPLPVSDALPEDDGEATRRLGTESYVTEVDVDPHEVDMVNAALYLRRPLLVTGRPGTGKSSLAYRIARELQLGRVLRWSITSYTTLKSGLYLYDAIARAQAAAAMQAAAILPAEEGRPADTWSPIGDYVRLGPLGTAFLPRRLPRVLLIDELDKSEADLPNDLLSIFEEGEFPIPELERVRNQSREVDVFTDDRGWKATISDGRVVCHAFPVVVITSNGERDFPPAFLRRCLRLEIRQPNAEQLAAIVASHLLGNRGADRERLIREFVERSQAAGGLPADRLLDAVYLSTSGAYREDEASWPRLVDALWRRITQAP